jgi:O-antigen/teichoic acid export membrane protein
MFPNHCRSISWKLIEKEKSLGVQELRSKLLGCLSQGIVKGAPFSLLSQAVVSGSNFLTGIIVAKATGASNFGVFSLMVATILALQGIQQSLITSPMIFLSEPGDNHKTRTSQYFMLQVLLSAPLAVGAAIAMECFLGQWSVVQVLGIISAVFFLQLQEFSRTRLYIDLQASKVFILDVVNHGLRLILLLCLWRVEALTVSSSLLVLAIASGLASISTLMEVTRQTFRVCADLAWRSFAYGRWLLAESLAYYISIPCYLFFSSALLSHEATGGLSAVMSLMNLPNVLVLGLMNLAVPTARRKLLDEGYGAWRAQLISTGATVVAVSVCLYIAMSVWGAFLLRTVYSQEFAKYANILAIIGTIAS